MRPRHFSRADRAANTACPLGCARQQPSADRARPDAPIRFSEDVQNGFLRFRKGIVFGMVGTVITTPESAAFDRGVRPVLQIVLPDKAEAVLSFRADPELQQRIEDLAAKSTEGRLTEQER